MNKKTALIIAPHPDDAEIAMGGTIVKMLFAGWNIILMDLTDGEPTPFGSPEIRAKESRAASEILGIKNRICLDMPNRYLEISLENRKKIAEQIRLNQPDVIFAPGKPDYHPDHVTATELVLGARFEAKYHKTNMAGQPHWTSQIMFYYSTHRNDHPAPSFIVDISDVWKIKESAINAYESQLGNGNRTEQYTLIEKVEIIARYFGQCINAEFGEPFKACQPLQATFMSNGECFI